MNRTIDVLPLPISQELEDLTYTNIELLHYDTRSTFKTIMSDSIKVGSIYQLDETNKINIDIPNTLVSDVRLYVFTNHAKKEIVDEIQYSRFEKGDKFKVIGLRTYKNKACLVVLHLPNENWKEFYKDNSSIDNQLLNVAVRDFEVQCDQAGEIKISSSPRKESTIKYSVLSK